MAEEKKKTIEQNLTEMTQKINENNGKISMFMESIKDYNSMNMNIAGSIVNMLMEEIQKLRNDVSQSYAKSAVLPPVPAFPEAPVTVDAEVVTTEVSSAEELLKRLD